MSATVHIRCGSDIEETLAAAGVAGDFLEFSDPVCQGPVSGPVANDRYFEARARFIADDWGYDFDETGAKLKQQSEKLDQLEGYERIILWFEHDVFDQTILLRLCAELGQRPDLHDRLFIQTTDRFPGIDRFMGFGQLSPDQLKSMEGREQKLAKDALDFGAKAWAAYCSDNPSTLMELSGRDIPGFPYLSAALRRFFQEYPWVGDGLSLTERLCLQAIAGGAEKAGHVFRDVYINREPQPFMGDVMFQAILKTLASADEPAVSDFEDWPDPISLTGFGKALLAGEADWTATNGIDRWFGGVCLHGKKPAWRWHDSEGRLVTAA